MPTKLTQLTLTGLLALGSLLIIVSARGEQQKKAPASEIQLKAELRQPPQERRKGTTLNYVVRLSWQGQEDEFSFAPPPIPKLDGLEYRYVDKGKGTQEEAAWVEFDFLLRPLRTREVRIGAMRFSYRHTPTETTGSVTAPAMTFKVKGRLIRWGKMFFWLLMLGAAAGIGYLGYLTVPALLSRAPAIEDEEDEISPLERLRGELSPLKMYVQEGEVYKFVGKLTNVMRIILSHELEEPLDNASLEQLESRLLESELQPNVKERIQRLLQELQAHSETSASLAPEDGVKILEEMERVISLCVKLDRRRAKGRSIAPPKTT